MRAFIQKFNHAFYEVGLASALSYFFVQYTSKPYLLLPAAGVLSVCSCLGDPEQALGEDTRKYVDIMQRVVNREETVVELELDDVLAVSELPPRFVPRYDTCVCTLWPLGFSGAIPTRPKETRDLHCSSWILMPLRW